MAFTPGGFGGTYTSSYDPMGGNRTGGNTLLYLLMPKPTPPAPAVTPVSPTIDPKIEANALYGKPMSLFVGGFARIGAGPAPIVGPYFNGDKVDFVVSFGVPANVDGDRKIFKIYLDNELAWSSVAGGTLPGHGTFAAESFDFVFKPGTLTQSAVSLEGIKFPGDECAYRPQMLLEIRNIPFARFMKNTGKPVPYVACDIGDVTDAAVPQDGINLGLALERLAFSPWAGYTSATFDAVGITDVVDAILIKDNFTVVQVCQTIAEEYRNLDVVLSDKVRFRDRGSNVAPNFIFNRDSIIADDAVTVTRGSATGQRREHELIAIDPEQDYTAVPSLSQIPRNPMVISAAVGKDTATLPVVIDASTRQALATFAQNYEENARRRVAFKARVSEYAIEPGDLFALTNIADGFDNEVFKVIETTHGANWQVEVEGEAILRCSIFHESVPGSAVVASGDTMGGIRYCYVAGSEPQEWHGHSVIDMGPEWPFYSVGSVIASSYAKVGGVPTFLMGGNDFVFVGFGRGIMMVSHDAINWTLVYESEDRRVIYNLVWDANEGAFYADFTGPWEGETARPPTPGCLRSTTGYVWEEVADDFWAHTSDRFTPDGRVGHDPETGLTIRPADLSLGTPIYCTAYANGVWMAGGGESGASITFTSLDGGTNWSVATSGGGLLSGLDVYNSAIRTIIAAPQSDIDG